MSSREERAADAQRLVELNEQTERREAAKAQVLIDEFVASMTRRGVEPVPLRARTLSGHVVKTDQRGWYLNRSHGLAIGANGEYFVLSVPGGWRERLTGVRLQPSQPSLQVGKGGRDGETGSLAEFLGWVEQGRVEQS